MCAPKMLDGCVIIKIVDFNLLLTTFLGVLAAGAMLFFAVSFAFYLQKRYILKQLHQFFDAPGEDEPSKFAIVVDYVGRVLAARIITQVKTTIGGMNSVDSKNAQREAVSEVVQSNPGLQAILPFLPKRMQKNADLLGMAAQVLGGMAGKQGGNHDSGTTDIKSPYSNV